MDPPNVIPLHRHFRVELLVSDAVTVVAVEGDIDLLSEYELSRSLDEAVSGSTAVLIDLCACSFMDSTGLGVVLQASKSAKVNGVRLAVACVPDGAPRALFDMVLGHSFFTTCDNRESGLAALLRAG